VIDIRHDENPLEMRSFAAIRRKAKRELPWKAESQKAMGESRAG
jgi:hypothetical protein